MANKQGCECHNCPTIEPAEMLLFWSKGRNGPSLLDVIQATRIGLANLGDFQAGKSSGITKSELSRENARLRDELRRARLVLDITARRVERLTGLLFDLSHHMTEDQHAQWRGHPKGQPTEAPATA